MLADSLVVTRAHTVTETVNKTALTYPGLQQYLDLLFSTQSADERCVNVLEALRVTREVYESPKQHQDKPWVWTDDF